jgi:hypothetical protein
MLLLFACLPDVTSLCLTAAPAAAMAHEKRTKINRQLLVTV